MLAFITFSPKYHSYLPLTLLLSESSYPYHAKVSCAFSSIQIRWYNSLGNQPCHIQALPSLCVHLVRFITGEALSKIRTHKVFCIKSITKYSRWNSHGYDPMFSWTVCLHGTLGAAFSCLTTVPIFSFFWRPSKHLLSPSGFCHLSKWSSHSTLH